MLPCVRAKISPALRGRDDTDLAALCLAEELAKLDATRGARREVEEATEEIDALADEGLTFRLSEAAKAREAQDPDDEGDTAGAPARQDGDYLM